MDEKYKSPTTTLHHIAGDALSSLSCHATVCPLAMPIQSHGSRPGRTSKTFKSITKSGPVIVVQSTEICLEKGEKETSLKTTL